MSILTYQRLMLNDIMECKDLLDECCIKWINEHRKEEILKSNIPPSDLTIADTLVNWITSMDFVIWTESNTLRFMHSCSNDNTLGVLYQEIEIVLTDELMEDLLLKCAAYGL